MSVLDNPEVHKASLLLSKDAKKQSTFSLSTLSGRITEINASHSTPVLSFLSILIREAQRSDEPVVWVTASNSVFYPPDLEENGIDSGKIPVVWCPAVRAAVRSTEHLLRSNGFGLVVIDLPPNALIDQGRLGKLAKLANLNGIALVIITQHAEDTSYTLGSIISLRFSGSRSWTGENVYTCSLTAIKDKTDRPGWRYTRKFHVPDSLC